MLSALLKCQLLSRRFLKEQPRLVLGARGWIVCCVVGVRSGTTTACDEASEDDAITIDERSHGTMPCAFRLTFTLETSY